MNDIRWITSIGASAVDIADIMVKWIVNFFVLIYGCCQCGRSCGCQAIEILEICDFLCRGSSIIFQADGFGNTGFLFNQSFCSFLIFIQCSIGRMDPRSFRRSTFGIFQQGLQCFLEVARSGSSTKADHFRIDRFGTGSFFGRVSIILSLFRFVLVGGCRVFDLKKQS